MESYWYNYSEKEVSERLYLPAIIKLIIHDLTSHDIDKVEQLTASLPPTFLVDE